MSLVVKRGGHGIERVGSYELNNEILLNRKVGGYVRSQKGKQEWKVELMGKSSWAGKLEKLAR